MTEEPVPYVVATHEPEEPADFGLAELLDRPIAFHRIYVTLTGSITAALMLSQAIYWTLRPPVKKKGGWFYKSHIEWTDETGMSKHEQETARKRLRQFDWWQEEKRMAHGAPTLHYRVHLKKMFNALATIARIGEIDCADRGNRLCGSGKSITETTTETTTEKTNTPKNQKADFSADVQPQTYQQEVDFGMGEKGETKEEREEHSLRSSGSTWEKERDKEWESIPSATEPKSTSEPGTALHETSTFAKQHKLLDGAPDTVRRISYLLHQYTGYIPVGPKQSWFQQINLLWEAARHNEQTLIEGLVQGEAARQKNGLTYSGPRGYVSFVRNAAAKPVQTVARRSTPNPNKHGQTVRQDKSGKTIITVT
jgi:hypothetical protein